MGERDGAPSPLPWLGDHSEGTYWWSAHPLDEADRGDDDAPPTHVPVGPIRFMWDYGVRVPLWDDTGLLPEEPAWLRTALGLPDDLVRDLTRWGADMDALDGDPRLRTVQAYAGLDARARALVARLERAIGDRYEVRYRPWVAVPGD